MLKDLNLSDCIMKDGETFATIMKKEINWNTIDVLLNKFRKHSEDFLKKALI